jgi:hypothetical protein
LNELSNRKVLKIIQYVAVVIAEYKIGGHHKRFKILGKSLSTLRMVSFSVVNPLVLATHEHADWSQVLLGSEEDLAEGSFRL